MNWLVSLPDLLRGGALDQSYVCTEVKEGHDGRQRVCYSEAERKEEAKKRLEKRLEKRENT